MAASEESPDRAIRLMRRLLFGLGAVLGVLSLWVVVERFRYPTDGEWMAGAIRDGVERVARGESLYGPPTARFVPFVYPPLYFWAAALVSRVLPTITACKVTSIGATAAAAWGVWSIAGALGASLFWRRVSLLLHVATYPLTILFYDLERVDAFYGGMLMLGMGVLLGGRSTRRTVLAALLLGLSFYAKQAGLLAFGSAFVGLLLAGERRRAVLFGVTGAVAFALLFAYLEVSTHGWFRYYCMKLPGAHGLRAERVSLFFIADLPKAFLVTLGSVALSVPVLWSFARRRKRPEGASDGDVVLAAVLAAALAASFSFRAHSGGWQNVLVAWLPLGAAATAIAASRLEERAKGTTAERLTSLVILGATSVQLLGAMFDPNELSPNRADFAEHERFVALVRELEKGGEVLITTTGNVAHPSSLHAAALYDIVRAGDRAPADLREGLAQRRYAAIFMGLPDEYNCGLPSCTELNEGIARNYFVAGRRHERDRNGMTGYDARPRWLFRPRKTPLPASLTAEQLDEHQRIEMGFAEMKSAHFSEDREIEPADDIEEMAARELSTGH